MECGDKCIRSPLSKQDGAAAVTAPTGHPNVAWGNAPGFGRMVFNTEGVVQRWSMVLPLQGVNKLGLLPGALPQATMGCPCGAA